MGTGGARVGAGRPRSHARVENCLSIDVQCWQREGRLELSKRDHWNRAYLVGGTTIASIHYRVEASFDVVVVTLAYSIGDRGVVDRVRVDRTLCTLGGSRPWFRCAGCDRRTAKIYFRGARFACRTCQRLVYASQSLDAIERGWRRQLKLESRLGCGLDRPKGMHQSTHEDLIERIRGCEARRMDAASKKLLSLFQRHAGTV